MPFKSATGASNGLEQSGGHTGFMSFAPKQDFRQFEAATAAVRLDIQRQASPIQKAERFVELVAICRRAKKPDLPRGDRQKRWITEKVPIRLRQIAAFNSDE